MGKGPSGVQLQRMGSNASLMSERRFRSGDDGTRRDAGGSVSSMGSRGNRKHGRERSLDSGVGSYSGDHAYGVPPPVPEIPEVYHYQNHGHGHRRQMSWQDHQHPPRRNNTNARKRRLDGIHTHPAAPEIKHCATCDCSCHSLLPTSSTYKQDEAEEDSDRLSLESIPETVEHSRQRYPGEYPHSHGYNHNYNTYSDEGDEDIILAQHSEAPRPPPLLKRPSTSSRRYSAPPRTTTNEITSPISPPPKNFFRLLPTSVNNKNLPHAPTPPTGSVKRFPSAGIGVGGNRSGVGSIRGSATRFEMLPTPTPSSPESVRDRVERRGSVQSGRGSISGRQVVVAGAEFSPPQSVSPSGSGYGNGNNQRRRRRGSGGSISSSSHTLLPDSSPSPPAGGRRHRRDMSDPPPPVPALPTHFNMDLHGPPPRVEPMEKGLQEGEFPTRETLRDEIAMPQPKSLRPSRQQLCADNIGGVVEEESPALIAARDAVRKKKVVAWDERERINSGSESKVNAGGREYGVRMEAGRKMWVQLEDVGNEPRGLGIFDDRVKVRRQEKVLVDSLESEEQVGYDRKRHAVTEGSAVLPEQKQHHHHLEIDLELPHILPLTNIPGKEEQENPVPRKKGVPVNQKQVSTKYKEDSSRSSSSSSEGEAKDGFHATVQESGDYSTPTPLKTTIRAPTPPLPPLAVEIPTLPPPLNIQPSTLRAPEHDYDRTATPSPTNESPNAQKTLLRFISRGEIPTVIHDPPPRSLSPPKGIMKLTASVKRDDRECMHFGESIEGLKKKSGLTSWLFRLGGGEKGKKEKVQKGKLNRRKDKDAVVLGSGPEVPVDVAVASPPSSSSLSGELLSPSSEGAVRKLSAVPEIEEPEPKPEPEHTAQQEPPGGCPEEWPQQSELPSSASTTTGVKITPLPSLAPPTSRRPPSTYDDTDEGSSCGASLYEDAREEFLPSSPTPVVVAIEDIPRVLSPPPTATQPKMYNTTRPSSSSTTDSASTSTPSTTSTTVSASAARKNRNRNLGNSSSRSPSPPIPSPSSRDHYTLPPATLTPKTKALIDKYQRQIGARKANGSASHMRPMRESDTETEVESDARANGKRRGTAGVAPGVGLNSHSAEGRMLSRGSLSRGSLRSPLPAAPAHPHPPPPPPVGATPTKSFFGFGGKDKAKEEDKHRLRSSHGHHQKKSASRRSKDSDSDSDDESPSDVRQERGSDAVGWGEYAEEREIEVRRLMEDIAKKKGVALTVDLDAPTSATTVHGEESVEEESEEELVTTNGTIGGEKDRRRKAGWGIFKDTGNQVNSQDGGTRKREPLPVMKAGEREDGASEEVKEGNEKEEREREKGREKGGKFKRMFSRGK